MADDNVSATADGDTSSQAGTPAANVVDLVNPRQRKAKGKSRQTSLKPQQIVAPPVSNSGERSPTWLYFNLLEPADEKGKNIQCIVKRRNGIDAEVVCGARFKLKDSSHGVGNLNRCARGGMHDADCECKP